MRRIAIVIAAALAAVSAAFAGQQDTFVRSLPLGETHNCASFYPKDAVREFIEGDVIVRYDVDADGTIHNAAVDRSSGSDALDQAALTCVTKAWKNLPATQDGKPVASIGLRSDVSFKIKGPVSTYEFLFRGRTYESRGLHDKAIADFTSAIAAEASNPDGYKARAAAYEAEGRHDLAKLDLDKLQTLPARPESLNSDQELDGALPSKEPTPYAQSCTAHYPPESVKLKEVGEVTVGYDIAADGTTRNAHILKTSGVDRLDQATLACVAAWHLPPVTRDGVAVSSAGHLATIRFDLFAPLPPGFRERWPQVAAPFQPSDPSISPARASGRTHDCSSYYPPQARRAMESGEVLIGYDVEIDGRVTNAKVLHSSGIDILDRSALACVQEQWHDEPATKDGAAIASPGHQAVITFSVR